MTGKGTSMTIHEVHNDVPRAALRSRDSAPDPEGQIGPMKDTDDWRDGRLVLRRPEARNSAIAKCYVDQTPEQAVELAKILAETVTRRRRMPKAKRAAELHELANLAARANLSVR